MGLEELQKTFPKEMLSSASKAPGVTCGGEHHKEHLESWRQVWAGLRTKGFAFVPGHGAPSMAWVGVAAPLGWSVLTPCCAPHSSLHSYDNKAEYQQRNSPWVLPLQHLPQELSRRSQLLHCHTIPMRMRTLFPILGRWHIDFLITSSGCPETSVGSWMGTERGRCTPGKSRGWVGSPGSGRKNTIRYVRVAFVLSPNLS